MKCEASWAVRTNDVECKIVVPGEAVEPDTTVLALPARLAIIARESFGTSLVKPIPLLDQLADVKADVGLELEYALLGKDVGHNLALPGVLGARPRVEETALDGHEGVVEVGLQGASAMPVDNLEGVRV